MEDELIITLTPGRGPQAPALKAKKIAGSAPRPIVIATAFPRYRISVVERTRRP